MYRNSHTALPSTSFRSNWPPLGLSNSYRSDPLPFGLSNSFRSDLPSDHKKTDEEPVGEFLWRDICRHMGIKDSSPEKASLCKYTWEIVACMMITDEWHSGPDIWPKTLN